MDDLLDEISRALSDTQGDDVTADLLAEAAGGDDEARSAVRTAVEEELASLLARVRPRASDEAFAVLELLATPGSAMSWVGGKGAASVCAFDPNSTANCELTVETITVPINNKKLVDLFVINMLANYAATPKPPFTLFEACRLRVQKMI